MPSTRSNAEPILSPDPELNCRLCRMNRNLGNLEDELDHEIPPPVEAHDQLLAENHGEGEIRSQPPAPPPHEYNRGNVNITDSECPLVLPILPHGHTFVVTSSLMQIFTAIGLFSRLSSEDPHAHVAKVRSVCKICVGRAYLNMNVIGLRLFPLSLT